MNGAGSGLVRPPYRELHLAYALVVLTLAATGLLIRFPDLRAPLLGGYGTSLATAHDWLGVAMIALPVGAAAAAPARALARLRAHAGRRDACAFPALYLGFTLVSGVTFAATGVALWFQASLPDRLLDGATLLHVACTYLLLGALPVHVATGRARARMRLAHAAARRPEEP